MTDDESKDVTVTDDDSPVIVRVRVEPQGVSDGYAILMALSIAFLMLACGYLLYNRKTDESAAVVQTRIQCDQARDSQKQVIDFQLKVAKACMDHGMVPVFLQMNVDCKPVGPDKKEGGK